ncbi:hypothetical protein Ac2012v2_007999 [Leucoagaricus gongylophorus]
MEDFPWEIFKGQTLQNLSQELGLTRDLAKDEAVGFLKAVQRKGLGPALTEEITKDLATGGPDQIQQDRNAKSPFTHSTKGKAVSSVPLRRISTRKRPAPEPESEQGATEDEGTQEGSDNVWKKRRGALEKEPKSITAIARNPRRRIVRVSDPGPPPARSTRSHGPAPSISAIMAPRKKTRRTYRRVKADTKSKGSAASAASLSERRFTRRSAKSRVPNDDDGTDADADGEDEIIDEEEGGGRFTGPDAVAAALRKANKETSAPDDRGRPSKRTRKDESMHVATIMKSKPHSATTSGVRSAHATVSTPGLRTTRTIRPTAKGFLLTQKKATSILSRSIRPEVRQRLQAQNTKKAENGPRSQHDSEANEKSGNFREVFDGVVLQKRRSIEPSRVVADAGAINGNAEGNLTVQLDEFIANGLAGQGISAGSVMDVERDIVLEENNFLFENIPESTEGPEIGRLPTGEEDAEGEPEHDTDVIMQDGQPQSQPQFQAAEPLQSIDDNPIPQLDPEHTEPQLEQWQLEPHQDLLASVPELGVQAELQTESQLDLVVIPQSIL